MKRILLSFILISFYLAVYCQKYSVGINLLSIPMSNLSINGETYLTKNSSLNLNLAFRPRLPFNDNSYYNNINGISITPSYRYYFKTSFNNSLFLGPYLRFQKYSTGTYYEGYDSWSGLTINKYYGIYLEEIGLGLNVGYRLYRDSYSLDFFIGPRFSKYLAEVRFYHLPNETKADFTLKFDELYDYSIPGASDVRVQLLNNYEKRTFSVKIPSLLIGFTFNYFLKKNKTNTVSSYEEFYN